MKELFEKYLNKQGQIFAGGLIVTVVVKDIKQAWGKDRFLVSPVAGEGEIWVESVTLI